MQNNESSSLPDQPNPSSLPPIDVVDQQEPIQAPLVEGAVDKEEIVDRDNNNEEMKEESKSNSEQVPDLLAADKKALDTNGNEAPVASELNGEEEQSTSKKRKRRRNLDMLVIESNKYINSNPGSGNGDGLNGSNPSDGVEEGEEGYDYPDEDDSDDMDMDIKSGDDNENNILNDHRMNGNHPYSSSTTPGAGSEASNSKRNIVEKRILSNGMSKKQNYARSRKNVYKALYVKSGIERHLLQEIVDQSVSDLSNGNQKQISTGHIPAGPMRQYPPGFDEFAKLGLIIEFYTAQTIPNEVLESLVIITEKNMKMLYNESPGWKWDDTKKRMELLKDTTRFIVIRMGEQESSSDDTNGSAHPQSGIVSKKSVYGYIAFTFIAEAGVELVYIRELHVDSQFHGKGIGSYLVSLVEKIARYCEMRLIMLTVLTRNASAMRFYKNQGYAIDEVSPGFCFNVVSSPYEIMSKVLDPANLLRFSCQFTKDGEKCEFKSRYPDTVHRHSALEHQNKWPHTCSICGRGTLTRAQLKRHDYIDHKLQKEIGDVKADEIASKNGVIDDPMNADSSTNNEEETSKLPSFVNEEGEETEQNNTSTNQSNGVEKFDPILFVPVVIKENGLRGIVIKHSMFSFVFECSFVLILEFHT